MNNPKNNDWIGAEIDRLSEVDNDARAQRIEEAEKAAAEAGSPTPLLSALMDDVFG